jgi:imidazolonepropionase
MLLTGTGRLAPGGRSPWALRVEGGRITWLGEPDAAPDAERVDVGTTLVTPGLVDSHTHPAFAGDRSDEAAARLEGRAYEAGGILRTVARTRATADDELESLVEGRLRAALESGTTTVECKSGYGLSVDEELRHLRIIRRAAARVPLRVVSTFLGAHAVPPEAPSAHAYAAQVSERMIPAVAADGLAEFVDVFADRGFFDLEATRRIADAATAAGLGVRLHADQLTLTGAARLGVEIGAASVDHLEQLDDEGVATLAGSTTVATLLPAPAIVLQDRLPPARALLDAGARVALASDANAGTYGGFGTMPLIVGLGATLLGMTVTESLTAATAGSGHSLRLGDVGRLEVGAR